jgi:hypothetical protein
MHCLISVVIRQWSAVHAEAQAAKRQLVADAARVDLPRPPVLSSASGFFVVVDWDEQRVLGGFELAKPTGFLLERGRLHVALWHDDQIATFDGPELVGRYRHRWFNHIHTLDRTARGLLVTSAGTDLIAELDDHGELIWAFFLFEHGYRGTRYRLAQAFDRSADYNQRYLPAALTTHPNSAILIDDDLVLATLFSPGELVRIDRRTSRVDVVLGGLHRPHSIRRRAGGGYMLCDTEGGAIVLLDRDLNLEARIPLAAPWIQDAVQVDDRLLVVANRRIVAGAPPRGPAETDGDNAVIELRHGALHKKLSLGADNRIYMVEPVTATDAETLAHAWRATRLDTPWLRWESACA